MSDVLVDLMNSGNQWAAERAQYALQVSNAVSAGQMSADEAKEVLTDLLNTQVLAEQAAEDQAKAALAFGIQQLISFLA
jgi:polyhydroxyalkanoate synthesis regulator phasin